MDSQEFAEKLRNAPVHQKTPTIVETKSWFTPTLIFGILIFIIIMIIVVIGWSLRGVKQQVAQLEKSGPPITIQPNPITYNTPKPVPPTSFRQEVPKEDIDIIKKANEIGESIPVDPPFQEDHKEPEPAETKPDGVQQNFESESKDFTKLD